jgi:hypothetical protein
MADATGHLEPLTAVIRVGGAYGDPFTWAAAVRYLNPSEVEIVGAVRAPSPSEWRKACQVLVEAGVRTLLFQRKRNGKSEPHAVHLGASAEPCMA